MDSQRNLLIIALLFVAGTPWSAALPAAVVVVCVVCCWGCGFLSCSQACPASGQGKLITVKTDVLELTINTNGGDIEQALLLAYDAGRLPGYPDRHGRLSRSAPGRQTAGWFPVTGTR
jgi:YidC/Oxa1 family membrane protein insertase